jgi:predicted secreted acid phosphatase
MRREAEALPGAREFLETVRRLGGKVAVVTNRGDEVCEPTEDNLRSLRLAYDVVLCKPVGGPSDKAPRWQAVEAGEASKTLPPLDVVMWVGDNIHDFPGGSQALAEGSEDALSRFGRDLFVLPNVMYGSWERNPPR